VTVNVYDTITSVFWHENHLMTHMLLVSCVFVLRHGETINSAVD